MNRVDFSVDNYSQELQKVLNKIDRNTTNSSINLIAETFRAGKKIITCGNGGSAMTASHYITDWAKMLNVVCGERFKGFALTDNVGLITAYANDISYEEIFKGQLSSFLDKDDLLVAISGSGNSMNVVNAVHYAKSTGAKTLGIVGYDGGKIIDAVDVSFHVPSFDMQICEDIHMMFGHWVMKTLCKLPINIS